MTTWRFPATGGTLWDDLWEDEPWRDYALEADRAQDAEEAARRLAKLAAELGVTPDRAALLIERYGWPAELAPEQDTEPDEPADVPPRRVVADPASLVDTQFTCAERRRRLDRSLTDGRLARPQEGAA